MMHEGGKSISIPQFYSSWHCSVDSELGLAFIDR
jgi:hypothetical protein